MITKSKRDVALKCAKQNVAKSNIYISLIKEAIVQSKINGII